MSIIKHLKIEKDYKLINPTYNRMIGELSRINIFIGANNTGKSRFMRSLFYINDNYKLKFIPKSNKYDKFLEQISEFEKSCSQRDMLESTDQKRAKNEIYKSLQGIDYLEESKINYSDLLNIYKTIQSEIKNYGSYAYECNEIFNKYFDEIEFNDNLFRYNFYKIYIPSLRGLIPLINTNYLEKQNSYDLYGQRVKQDYFNEEYPILTDVGDFLKKEKENENSKKLFDLKEVITNEHEYPKHSIISGMLFYDYVKNYLLGDLKQREIIKDYENYLSETFFDNNKVALIPKVNDDVLTIKIGDEKERPIYNFGEGIQSIILITLPLFLYQEKAKEKNTNVLVFIEEPEIGLHPELQKILIKTLLDERFENYQFFFTTHSNHFIDQTLLDESISLYLFDKELDFENSKPKFSINRVNNEYWEIMEELGAQPSSVLMANCTILVEGVTDRGHFQKYLELYQKQLSSDKPKFKENIHYSFLIAGGSECKNTLKSLNELQKEKICFICDYDDEQQDIERKKFFEEYPLNNQYTLTVTEVENLISKSVIIDTLKNTYGLEEKDLNLEFSEEKYINSTNFYEFIKENVISCELPKKFPKSKNPMKNPLCRTEKNTVKEFDELTQEAKDVAQIIYKFIEKNN